MELRYDVTKRRAFNVTEAFDINTRQKHSKLLKLSTNITKALKKMEYALKYQLTDQREGLNSLAREAKEEAEIGAWQASR